MTFTVAILAQKGGTRKSTIARAIAVQFIKGGWDTTVVDMDANQGTAGRWSKRRNDRKIEPAVSTQMQKTATGALAAIEGYDLAIIDGKGFASEETTIIAKAADLILIPSGQGVDDLEPSVLLAHALVAEGVDPARILIPLTNMGKSLADIAEAREYLADAGYQSSPGFLSIMTCYSQAHDAGRAVTEVAAPGPRAQANEWIGGIIARIEQLLNQSN